MTRKSDTCPMCIKQFQKQELLVKFWEWEGSERSKSFKLAHLDCALHLSQAEKHGKHPPKK